MTLLEFKSNLKKLIEEKNKEQIIDLINEFYTFRKELLLRFFDDYIKTIDKDEYFINLLFQSDEYHKLVDEINNRFDNSKEQLKEIVVASSFQKLKEILNPVIFTEKRKYRIFHYENLFKRYYLRKITTRYKLEKNKEKEVFRVSIHNTRCHICIQYEGKYLVKYNPKNPNELPVNSSTLPPYHPHCRHTISPVTDYF